MASVPPIPPLLCNTPPPIDFGDEDDGSGLPPTLTLDDEDEFGEFTLGVDINEDAMNVEASSLPRTPLPFELSSSTTSGFTDVPPTLEDCGGISTTPPELNISPTHEATKTKAQLNEAFNYSVVQKSSTESDALEFNDTVKKLAAENENAGMIDTESTPSEALSKAENNEQYSTDYNDAKITTITPDVQNEHKAGKPTETSAVQEFQTESSKPAALVQDIKIKPNTIPVTGLVLLEDIADDSSDEECHCSPKKTSTSPISPAATNENTNSDDFFAIHVVDELTSPKEDKLLSTAEDINMNNFSNQNNNIFNDVENGKNSNITVVQQSDDDDFGDFADFESTTEFINSPKANALPTTNLVDSNKNIKVEESPMNSESPVNNIDVDFDDFQDFTTAPISALPISALPIASATTGPIDLSIMAKNDTETKCAISMADKAIEHTEDEARPIENIDDDDDDDDFGDFEEASFATPSNTQTPHTPILQTQAANINVNERLGTVLKMMFPIADEAVGEEIQDEVKTKITKELPNLQSPNAKLPFEAIEAAKALEFQWPQSEIRHALIRSIGIDSRNILFGDNWNPSMPRFAANLSFNPLKPMKPKSANNATPATYTDVDTMPYGMSNANAAELDMNNYAKRTDVPDVEFDWQGAGLVNPLEGVKGEANTRETETILPPSPTPRLDTPDDQSQSYTTYTNIDDTISETLSKNETNELTASPTRDTCPSPLTLDNNAYQFTTQHQGINMHTASNSDSSSANNSISNIKSYDNSKTITALRLVAVVADDDDDDNETVATSTYAGPLKETHIYTPSKTELAATGKAGKSTVIGNEPIDFDYEIAAAGIIIDEKVVKKEYRDVEYNPGFSLEVVNEYGGELTPNKTESFGVVSGISTLPLTPTSTSPQTQQKQQETANDFDTDEFTEFTEFQSVPPPSASHAAMSKIDDTFGHTLPTTNTITSKFTTEHNTKTTLNSLPHVLPAAIAKTKEASNTPSRTNSPSIIDNMILSPAILLPQAIPINSSNATTVTKAAPTIEWGDSTANINPDELARIEELFSQPKISLAVNDANSSQKSTPTHAYAESQAKGSTISISASVALKEQDSTLNDDYWSEFVSVPVAPPQLSNNASRLNNNSAGISNNNNNNNKNNNNNNQSIVLSKRMGDLNISNSNNAMRSPRHHPHQQHQHQQHQQQHNKTQRTLTPTPQQKSIAHSVPFNSNSNSNSNSNDDDWSDFVSSTPTPAAAPPQHANSYMPATHAPQFNSAAWQNANFYNNPLGLYNHQATMQMRSLTPQQQQLQLQQQIHIMQDFSTAPISNRPQNTTHSSNNSTNINNSMQHSNAYSPLQVGNARVAPSISLIPDLGFVAPALPVHTAFVNVLPKTSFNGKK